LNLISVILIPFSSLYQKRKKKVFNVLQDETNLLNNKFYFLSFRVIAR